MFSHKDKRIKGCWNPKCSRCRKQHKYTAQDKYCSLCGRELVFVCARCGGLLEDEGRRHRVCWKCQERRENAKGDRRAAAASIATAAADVGNVIAKRLERKDG